MRTLCIDFDGVCSKYDFPFDEKNIPDDPVEGLFAFLKEASNSFKIVIYSSRSKTPEGIELMRQWFLLHLGKVGPMAPPEWFSQLEFAAVKPPAFLTIDDRCFLFEGTWPDVQTLLDFKPWNKRKKS
jgi:hypothetical protein